ncbi:TetR family transcriptional regulator C-terminal domain-containing protein [Aliamphritea spongicola]|nr:TetR family transcriptional regulator C-terminal domain-containing protein [Aliamphritea spongicola]
MLNYHHAQEIAKWRDHFATTEGRRLQQIRVMIDSFVDDYRQDPNLCGCLLTNLMGEVGNLSDSFRKVVQTSSDEVISFMTEDLIIAQSEGDVRTDIPVEAMAKIFWDSWQGALLRTKVGGSTQPLHETVDTLFSLLKPLKAQARRTTHEADTTLPAGLCHQPDTDTGYQPGRR